MPLQSCCYARRTVTANAPAARHKDQDSESNEACEVVSNGLPPPLPSPVWDVDVEVEVAFDVVDVVDSATGLWLVVDDSCVVARTDVDEFGGGTKLRVV